jgi:hypothetical protein
MSLQARRSWHAQRASRSRRHWRTLRS